MISEPHDTTIPTAIPTAINDALSRLREATGVPPVDPLREQALLAAFDARWARPQPRSASWVWAGAAASLAIVVALMIQVTGPPAVVAPARGATVDWAGFVPWPGAHALPPLESGELRRVELPRSVLPALGLSAPPSAVDIVQADLVIGQDGLARAVRLVHQQ